MNAVGAILAGLLVGLGAVMVGYGWLAPPRRPRARRGLTPALRVDRSTVIRLLCGVAAGFGVWLTAGWAIAPLVFPVALVGVPALLRAPSREPLERLAALEEWTRSLAGVLTVGVGLEQAILATARSAPPAIAREVHALAGRITARTPTDVALRQFGADLGDATGDLVVLSLLLGASRRGSGLSSVLTGLADSVADEARIRRAVEADRAKLRTAARWITGITLVVLGGLFWNGEYVAPYQTPFGQILLLLQLGAYAAALVWLRALAAGQTPGRLLGQGQP